jgi:3-oxoacyl-[acyl-carrier-protein] synthase II
MTDRAVAITGVGVVCGIGSTAEEFWNAVRAGRSGIDVAQQNELAHAEAFVSEVDDARLKHRVDEVDPTGRAAGYDRISLMAVAAAAQAVSNSGLRVESVAGRVGIVTGKCQLEGAQRHQWMHAPGEDVAQFLGIEGPRTTVSTACAAGAHAIGMARDKLLTGEADVMLAGGVDALTYSTFVGFGAMRALSQHRCAPYSRSDGLNLGEGAAYLVIERIEDANARGATILATFDGYGLSADAHHATAPDPTGRGAAAAVRRAVEDAAITLEEVDYVSGHGTGTPANDSMERKAMRSLFGDRVTAVPISSMKSFIGHTLGASGAIEAVACVLAVRDDVLPPTLSFEESKFTPDLDFVPNRARPQRIDVAVSNNYAFGGNNCSIVIGKATRRIRSRTERCPATPVAVTGLGVVSGFGVGLDPIRRAFAEGGTSIRDDGSGYASETCALDGKDFAPANDWRHMKPISRQALAAARLALADAGCARLSRRERDGVAFMMGTSFGPAATIREYDESRSALAFSQLTMNAPAGSVCQVLGLRGPTATITTGALSGTVALSTALEHIQQGKLDRAVVVATDEFMGSRAARDIAVAPDGVVRPFDRDRARVLGSAAVAIVLERPELARRDGRRVYCDILSTFQTSDRADDLGWDESGRTMAAAMRGALDRADVAPEAVDLYVAWAGGFDADLVEARAVDEVFGTRPLVCAPKSVAADCESASGLFGIVTAALAISEGLVPPILGSRDLSLVPPLRFAAAPLTDAVVRRAVAFDACAGTGSLATVLAAPGTVGAFAR